MSKIVSFVKYLPGNGTGAGMLSPHPLQRTVKSQKRASGRLNMVSIIGELLKREEAGLLGPTIL
jgi:hypothetical protein